MLKEKLQNWFREASSYHQILLSKRTAWQRYGLVIFLIILMPALNLSVKYVFNIEAPFLISTLIITFSAIYGDFWTSLSVTIFMTILLAIFFPDHGSSVIIHSLMLSLLFLEGLIISALVEYMRFLYFNMEVQIKKARDEEERFHSVVNDIKDYAIIMLDQGGYVHSWNTGATRLNGYTQEEIIGHHYSIFYTEEDRFANKTQMELDIACREGHYEDEGLRIRKDGSTYWANVAINALREGEKRIRGFVVIIQDMTERKQVEELMHHQAFHDILTGLPNRALLKERLELYLEQAKRKSLLVAVMFLDLDRFKNINDTLGHEVGDLLLKEVSERLKRNVREEDTVARFGGDEFIVVVGEIRRLVDILDMGKKLADCLKPQFSLAGHKFHINASIGIAIYPNDGNDPHTLLKNADVALYQSKEAGRDMVKLYSRTMNIKSEERLSLENNLRQAIEKEEFEIYYQPIYDLKKQIIQSAEALVRWKNPEHGLIFPNEFIPLAEETGMIIQIGEWVLTNVFQQQELWSIEGMPRTTVSVNLSSRQFNQPELLQAIQKIQLANRGDPSVLELEITESVAMHEIDQTVYKLEELSKAGYTSVIDDFGIGFSSLNYIKKLPISKLKIDKSFIQSCINDPRDLAIVKAIITMAHSLKLKVLAEGVENPEQLTLLTSMGCDQIQGYLISRPLPANEFRSLLLHEYDLGHAWSLQKATNPG
jgi:diguanylate cyclase (GGDEF)-like protein/PAS domain S-box-containing protein